MTAPRGQRGPQIKAKPRPVEPDLRRAIGSAWANYLLRLSRGLDDLAALRELDVMAAALMELREATAIRVASI